MQDVIGAAPDGDVHIVKDNGIGHGPFRRIGELEVRLDSTTASVFLRDDTAVGECSALHQQRRQFESTPSAGTLCVRCAAGEQHECQERGE